MTAEQKAWMRAGMALNEALRMREPYLYLRRRAVEEHENHFWQEEFGDMPAFTLDKYRAYRTDFLRLLKEAREQ